MGIQNEIGILSEDVGGSGSFNLVRVKETNCPKIFVEIAGREESWRILHWILFCFLLKEAFKMDFKMDFKNHTVSAAF